eukprot:6239936-Prymnesium_polylepis.1
MSPQRVSRRLEPCALPRALCVASSALCVAPTPSHRYMQYCSEHAMQQRAEAIAIEKYDGDGEALVKGRVPRRQMVGQRVVVDYEEESTTDETVLVRYAGVVVDYTVSSGLHVKFDGDEEEQDWAWVDEEGEDDWEWEGGAAAA